MTMAISALPKLAKTDLTAAPGPSADGTSFAAMLGGVTPAATAAGEQTATGTAAPAGKGVRAKPDAVDPSLAGLSVLMAAPMPAAPLAQVPTQAAPTGAADAGQGASSPAQTAPAVPTATASAAAASATAAAPAASLTPEEMAALAPALQLLAAHQASGEAPSGSLPDQATGQSAVATTAPISAPALPGEGQQAAARVATPPLQPVMARPRGDDAARSPQDDAADPAVAPPVVSDTASILSARTGVQAATKPAARPQLRADGAQDATAPATDTTVAVAPKAAAPSADRAQNAATSQTGDGAAAAPALTPVADTKVAMPVIDATADAAPARAAQVAAAPVHTNPSADRLERSSPRKTDKKADTTDKTASTAARGDEADPATAGVAVTAAPAMATASAATGPHSATIDTAGQQLAQGGADRALDLAKGNAWLDGLSRDIAATGDAKGTLNFQVAPQQLGLVSVAVKQGEDGASVSITAASEKARDLIADARPQLIAEAQANGLRIASAQVDVSTQQQASDQGRNGQQQGGHPSHQPASQQPAQAGSGSFSAQAGMGGGDDRSSQTRYQPISDTPLANPFRGGAPADSADDAPPADGLYA